MASVRPDSFKGSPSDVSCKMSDKVGNVEARFMKDMGVKIQVLNSDGSLCDDDKTLGELQREQLIEEIGKVAKELKVSGRMNVGTLKRILRRPLELR